MPGTFCHLCGASFTLNTNLSAHIKLVHHKEDLITKQCEHCDYVGLPQNLRQHVRNVHGDIKFKCDMCDNSFTTKPR